MKNALNYTGFKEVCMTESEMSEFYCNLTDNKFGCLINEYLIIKNLNNDVIDCCVWDGKAFTHVATKTISSGFYGKIKARNSHQILAIDMLYNPDITVKALTGKAGSGKSMLMIHAALDLVKRGKFDKIVYIRNNVFLKNTENVGALPGNLEDKLLPFYGGLIDHIGDLYSMRTIIEPVHLGFIRGRSIPNSIILVNEAENLSRDHIELLITRVAEGSQLWLDGDIRQIDKAVFETNNGLVECVNILKGNPLFSIVELQKSERSATARLADLFQK